MITKASSMTALQQLIEQGFEERQSFTHERAPSELRLAVEEVIDALDKGLYRVAEKINDQWVTHQWLKKAILL